MCVRARCCQDPRQVHDLSQWIAAVSGEEFFSFREGLISGRLLCLLLSRAVPDGTDCKKFRRRDGGLLELYLRYETLSLVRQRRVCTVPCATIAGPRTPPVRDKP